RISDALTATHSNLQTGPTTPSVCLQLLRTSLHLDRSHHSFRPSRTPTHDPREAWPFALSCRQRYLKSILLPESDTQFRRRARRSRGQGSRAILECSKDRSDARRVGK